MSECVCLGERGSGAPSILIIPTLEPEVYRYDLFWAIWSPRENVHRAVRSQELRTSQL